jgi:hypothetical protein
MPASRHRAYSRRYRLRVGAPQPAHTLYPMHPSLSYRPSIKAAGYHSPPRYRTNLCASSSGGPSAITFSTDISLLTHSYVILPGFRRARTASATDHSPFASSPPRLLSIPFRTFALGTIRSSRHPARGYGASSAPQSKLSATHSSGCVAAATYHPSAPCAARLASCWLSACEGVSRYSIDLKTREPGVRTRCQDGPTPAGTPPVGNWHRACTE